MIQVAYTNIHSKTKINGLLKQCCPLPVLLCIIAAEVFAVFINDVDTRIEGIRIGDYEIKILNFADDTTIF